MGTPVVIAQLSDSHVVADGLLGGVLDTAAYLGAAVDAVNAMDRLPDMVLVTGDLVDDGARAAYERFADVMDGLRCGWFALPGNHDDAATMADVLAGHVPVGGPRPGSGVLEVGGVSIVCVCSARPGRPDGEFDDVDAVWLAAELAAAPRALVALHHPPVDLGLRAMDSMHLDEPSTHRLGAVFAAHPPAAVLCGHVHRASFTAWADTVVTTCPGTAHSIAFDLSDRAPLAVALDPPAMLVHRVADQVVTHVVAIGEFPRRVLDEPVHGPRT
jgi:3',5'-cyclic AMP phosphodiesterase CpdA